MFNKGLLLKLCVLVLTFFFMGLVWWAINSYQMERENRDILGKFGSEFSGVGAGIAIVDSGVDSTKGVFSDANFGTGWNVIDKNTNVDDSVGHGTKVASLIASNGRYGCTRGMARGAKLFVYKSGDKKHYARNEKEAILHAAHNDEVDIILITVGGGRRTALNAKVLSALMIAVTKGKAVVTVTGNGGGTTPVQPSALAGMLNAPGVLHIIAGASSNGVKAAYSHQFGKLSEFGIMAPGKAMVPSHSGFCVPTKGTSFSAPRVASVLALLVEAFPNISMRERVQGLLEGAARINGESKSFSNRDMGKGMVSFDGAYKYLKQKTFH